MSDNDAAQLVLGPLAMQHNTQTEHDPRQPWCGKDKQTQEAELDVWMTPSPDVDEGAAEGASQEHDGKKRREA